MYGKSKGRSGPKDPQIMPGLGPGLQQRFKEMSAQESLIAQKKKQIEEKLLEEKRKEKEQALNKTQGKGKKDTSKVNPIRYVWAYVVVHDEPPSAVGLVCFPDGTYE